SGAHDWENHLESGIWTYNLNAVWSGLQDAFSNLAADVQRKFGVKLKTVGAMGISGMMHGYLPFDAAGNQLVQFRTWRNTITEQAAADLTEKFHCNIPQRWSIAHLYQAILNKEPHVNDISFLTTLAGYVHWKLTGQKVLGVGDASGMFPIDSSTGGYSGRMMEQFEDMVAGHHFGWSLSGILPRVLHAGDEAGVLTAEGAGLLDPTGTLQPGIPMCPPEGDAGTGMIATNSVAERTGNVSAGTSVFAMVVLEKELSKVYTELDMVTTPAGKPVAMVHCNNCTGDLDAWIKMFHEVLRSFGMDIPKFELYDEMYFKALEADTDAGGLLHFNYYSGEPITGMEEGRPLFTRLPDAKFNLANFMRSLLYSAMATLRIGMDILTENEGVKLEQLLGHGGLFKTEGVGQRLMAAALNVPVAVMETAGEGGPLGMALLAAFMGRKNKNETLEAFLADKVFADAKCIRVLPEPGDKQGFSVYLNRYSAGLHAERAASRYFVK
ncbi:MAG TPA: FGGY-family carbohydrate kinase, partial [Ruminiclostridium sp.]|nr:FGGY-family carbohydrate kinase [Ruminiclostridium sp.]